MKIAFDYQIFCQQSFGGISRYYKNLTDQLIHLNQNTAIFAGFHRNNYLTTLPKAVVNGYRLNKYPPKTGKLFNLANHYLTEYQIKSWHPQIIHETYYSKFSYSSKYAPRVVTAYDMIHELFPKEFNKNDSITQRKLQSFIRADHIISISHNTKRDLIELFGIPSEKITVVYLAPEKPLSITNSDLYNVNSKPFLLYVGPRSGYKNFFGLLDAYSNSLRLMNEFDIVAFGGGNFTTKELSIISHLGLNESQVKQVGGNDSVLVSLYKEASAFVYPSLYEGFGIPPLEAMTYKCPVVSSNISSMPEVIGNAGEYFDPKDPESIKTAIENVVFSDSRIVYLKDMGSERLKMFSWKSCAEETLEIYKNIVG